MPIYLLVPSTLTLFMQSKNHLPYLFVCKFQPEQTPDETTTLVDPPLPTPPLFHIPDSNASDVGHSEHNNGGSSAFSSFASPAPQPPLTAKQQVALWLTRTSMTDLSSVPSLKSLVFR